MTKQAMCVECSHSRHLDGQCQEADQEWMGHSSVPIPCECTGDLNRRAHQYGVELAEEADAQPLSELLAAAWLDGHAVGVESMVGEALA